MSWLKLYWKKVMISLAGALIVLGSIWYAIWGLKAYEVTPDVIADRYSYQANTINMKMVKLAENSYSFSYTSFDGETVNGQIKYPDNFTTNNQSKLPILIGIHAMGRSENRWWVDSFKGRATLEQTNKITEKALSSGYAVIAIDSRNHGQRKDLNYSIFDIMNDLHLNSDNKCTTHG